jgi:hypothetical protein
MRDWGSGTGRLERSTGGALGSRLEGCAQNKRRTGPPWCVSQGGPGGGRTAVPDLSDSGRGVDPVFQVQLGHMDGVSRILDLHCLHGTEERVGNLIGDDGKDHL